MEVVGLWRYPVKSLRGEASTELELAARGVVGDRMWALVDPHGGIASGKPTRRFRRVPGLMRHASFLQDGLPVISFSGGDIVRADDPGLSAAISASVGPGWRLEREGATSYLDLGAVSVLTSATLARIGLAAKETVEPERLRPNILIHAPGPARFLEDEWVGCELLIGSAKLRVRERTVRCAVTNHAQNGLPYRQDVLRTIGRLNKACAGVYAEVLKPGRVQLGDTLTIFGS